MVSFKQKCLELIVPFEAIAIPRRHLTVTHACQVHHLFLTGNRWCYVRMGIALGISSNLGASLRVIEMVLGSGRARSVLARMPSEL